MQLNSIFFLPIMREEKKNRKVDKYKQSSVCNCVFRLMKPFANFVVHCPTYADTDKNNQHRLLPSKKVWINWPSDRMQEINHLRRVKALCASLKLV